ncbi:DNA topoisomerase 1 [bacterium AB1]|nr:DNA topoisomerase 1 [bacterium AB1]
MSYNVLFVESPKKVKIFQESLKNKIQNLIVLSTKGHIREVNIKGRNFSYDPLVWVEKSNCGDLIKKLIKLNIDKNTSFFIATDADREGESIGYHLQQVINTNFNINPKMYRMYFNQIDKNSIIKSYENTINNNISLDFDLINAYISRVYLDIMIGIHGSQILWRKIKGCPSMGRVQSIVILLIYLNEKEIRSQKRQLIYKIIGSVNKKSVDKVYIDDKLLETFDCPEKINKVLEKCKNAKFRYLECKEKILYSSNLQPLETSTLLSSMSNQSVMITTSTAQSLYEEGYITYMRTDSKFINPEFVKEICSFIEDKYGRDYLKEYNVFRSKSTNQQEAHEAIRITNLSSIQDVYNKIVDKHKSVYEKIVIHTIGPWFKNTEYTLYKHVFISDCETIKLECHFQVISSMGIIDFYKDYAPKLYQYYLKNYSDNDLKSFSQDLLNVKTVFNVDQYYSNSKPRYTESSIITKMKSLKIGRPSTYNSIINTVKNKYVLCVDGKFYMKGNGIVLINFLNAFFSKYVDFEFTANMEEMLDIISQNSLEYKNKLSNYFDEFENLKSQILLNTNVYTVISENVLKEMIYSSCSDCNNFNLKFVFAKTVPLIVCEQCAKFYDITYFGYKANEYAPKKYVGKKESIYNKIKYKNKKN